MALRNVLSVAAVASVLLRCGGSTEAPRTLEVDSGIAESRRVPVELASDQNRPWSIVVDDENIYWLNAHSTGGVYKLPKSGGGRVPLTEGSTDATESIAADHTSVYFPLGDAIVAAPIAGGATRTVVAKTRTRGVAIANGALYWIEPALAANPQVATPLAKRVMLSGGAPTEIALPSAVKSIANDGYFVVPANDAVYASLLPSGGIVRIPLDGSPTNLLDAPGAKAIAVDEQQLFFTATQVVNVMSKAAGTLNALATSENSMGVALDDTFVYFADNTSSGRIVKVPKVGGSATVIADHQGAPHGIAVDDRYVYWTCVDEGKVKKIEK